MWTHRLLIASRRPTLRALLTISGLFTLPICLRFIFDGLGSLSIQSGTVDPDCRMTLAILEEALVRKNNTRWIESLHGLRFQKRAIIVREECDGFSLAPSATRSP